MFNVILSIKDNIYLYVITYTIGDIIMLHSDRYNEDAILMMKKRFSFEFFKSTHPTTDMKKIGDRIIETFIQRNFESFVLWCESCFTATCRDLRKKSYSWASSFMTDLPLEADDF